MLAKSLSAFPADLRFMIYDLRLEEEKIVNTQGVLRRQSKIQILIEPLTNREQDVLLLLAQRLTDKEISERLVISLTTVRFHTRNIYTKLNVHTRQQAVARATDLGLVTPPIRRYPKTPKKTLNSPSIIEGVFSNQMCHHSSDIKNMSHRQL